MHSVICRQRLQYTQAGTDEEGREWWGEVDGHEATLERDEGRTAQGLVTSGLKL